MCEIATTTHLFRVSQKNYSNVLMFVTILKSLETFGTLTNIFKF